MTTTTQPKPGSDSDPFALFNGVQDLSVDDFNVHMTAKYGDRWTSALRMKNYAVEKVFTLMRCMSEYLQAKKLTDIPPILRKPVFKEFAAVITDQMERGEAPAQLGEEEEKNQETTDPLSDGSRQEVATTTIQEEPSSSAAASSSDSANAREPIAAGALKPTVKCRKCTPRELGFTFAVIVAGAAIAYQMTQNPTLGSSLLANFHRY